MTTIHQPSSLLPSDIASQIAAVAREAETLQDLHPRQLALIHEQKWLRMFIPKSLGGLGLSLPEVVRLEESLAWVDGSTAWVVTLCAGAGWFVGFVEPAVAKEFFTVDRFCAAGSGSMTGTAEVLRDGYLINGFWPYASGALHATVFTANCVIHENDKPLMTADGTPQVLPFILKPDEVEVKKTWNTTGMIATASHSFSVSNVTVPKDRCFMIHPSAANLNDPVYLYPFLQLAETTLVANVSGMTIRFLELAAKWIADGSPGDVATRQNLIHNHTEKVNSARILFYAALDNSWQQLIGNTLHEAVLQEVSRTSYGVARACRNAIDDIYQSYNLREQSNEDLNRVWRNIQTALSHALFRKRLAAESHAPS